MCWLLFGLQGGPLARTTPPCLNSCRKATTQRRCPRWRGGWATWGLSRRARERHGHDRSLDRTPVIGRFGSDRFWNDRFWLVTLDGVTTYFRFVGQVSIGCFEWLLRIATLCPLVWMDISLDLISILVKFGWSPCSWLISVDEFILVNLIRHCWCGFSINGSHTLLCLRWQTPLLDTKCLNCFESARLF